MNPGPPCPGCKAPLKWYQELHQWGCEQCRMMYPVVPQIAALAARPSQPIRPSRPPAPKGSRAGLWIGIAITLVVAGGATATLLLLKSGDNSTPGKQDAGVVAVAPKDAAAAAVAPPAPKDAAAATADAPATTSPSAVTLGTGQAMTIADFWLYPRSDGTYLVRSTLVEAVFAHKPTDMIEASPNKTADGQAFDLFTIKDELGGRGLVQLQLMSLGRGARDVHGLDAVKKLLATYGTVHETKRKEGAVDVTRLEVSNGDTQLVVDSRLDLPRGLIVVATTATTTADRAIATNFLASIHLRDARDPMTDASALTGVRIRKAGSKFIVHDATDSFTLELPWNGKVERKPGAAPSQAPQVTITAEKKKAKIVIQIGEVAAWDGLMLESPTRRNQAMAKDQASTEAMLGGKLKRSDATIAGMPAVIMDPSGKAKTKIQLRSIYNRYQHRKFDIVCVDAPCDAVAASLHFPAATAPPP